MFRSEKADLKRTLRLADTEATLLQAELALKGVNWEPLRLYGDPRFYRNPVAAARTPVLDGREFAANWAITEGRDVDSVLVVGVVAAAIFANSAGKLGEMRGDDTALKIADSVFAARVFEAYLRHVRKRPDLADAVEQGVETLWDRMRKQADDESDSPRADA